MFYIFECYETGNSYGKISVALADMEIVSPTGKAVWSRETISKLLSNEKYVGNVILGKTQVVDGVQVKSSDARSQARIKPSFLANFLMLSRKKNVRGAGTEWLSDE